MKIWITRDTTGSLHAGGLERCQVWFVKPIYKYYDTRPVSEIDHEIPWGVNPLQGLGRWGWEAPHSHNRPTEPISFGKLFGYGDSKESDWHVDGIAEYVWSKLLEHYKNNDFPHGWYSAEKKGICRQEDFLLEIDLQIKFIKPNE
jgi:hypothetical protein